MKRKFLHKVHFYPSKKNILIILVQERPSIGAIEISGSKEFDQETLLSALKFTKRRKVQVATMVS